MSATRFCIASIQIRCRSCLKRNIPNGLVVNQFLSTTLRFGGDTDSGWCDAVTDNFTKSITFTGLLAALSSSVMAANVPQMTFDELLKNTSIAFRGKVIKRNPGHYDRSRAEPVTRIVFQIDQVLFGATQQQQLEFYIPGGRYPSGEVLEYDSAPVFNEGSDYLVFVRDGPWSVTPVTNWWHSAFRETTIAGETVMVNQLGQGVTSVGEAGFEVGQQISQSETALIARDEGVSTGAIGAVTATARIQQSNNGGTTSSTGPEVPFVAPPLAEVSCSSCLTTNDVLDNLSELLTDYESRTGTASALTNVDDRIHTRARSAISAAPASNRGKFDENKKCFGQSSCRILVCGCFLNSECNSTGDDRGAAAGVRVEHRNL